MSDLIKSAINYKVSCFVNFKTDKDGREFCFLNPKVQQKNKDSGAYEEKKSLFLDEALALVDVLERAIAHAQNRLQPIGKVGANKDFEKSAVAVDGQPAQAVEFDTDDIPFSAAPNARR
jgi:hypothetical protein